MAQYCASCGKVLPEGAEVCPYCGGEPDQSGGEGAALFTQISAKTEEWQHERTRLSIPKPNKSQTQLLAYILVATAAVALAVFLILYIQPVNGVIRAIGSGDYDKAMELYWGNTSLAAGDQDRAIQNAASRAAAEVVSRYGKRELTDDEAAAALGKLGTFGQGAEEALAGPIASYRALNASRAHESAGDRLTLQGEYLAARQEYLQVSQEDSGYAQAQEKAATSLDRYTESVLSEADVFIQSRDVSSAILSLENGKRILLGFDVYNEKLDYKLQASYHLLERSLLAEGEAAAKDGDLAGAVRLLETATNRFDFHTEALDQALEGYRELAREKALDDTEARASALYEEGRYEEAFTLLEDMRSSSDAKKEEAERAIRALEERFAADQIALAQATFGGVRENLPTAVSGLKAALRIRELEALQSCLDELSTWLPASLAELEYVEKQGTIFRSASAFEALDGQNYADGWVWGEDGAELTFVLSGVYDRLEGVLAVRREDEEKASGSFTVLCDGEERFVSDTLTHPSDVSIPVSVDISGCQRLTLRFTNDYTVRTAAGGYCYHGLCSPVVTRDLPAAAAAPAAAEPVAEAPAEQAAQVQP